MSLEGWKSVFEIGGVILLFVTFVFGAGVVFTSYRINAAQSRELRDFKLRIEGEQQKTAQAQKEAAEAQLALRSYIDAVAKKAEPRRLDANRFLECLKGKPKGTVAIWYKAEDKEAYRFARQIYGWLGSGSEGNGAGWNVSEPTPIPSNAGDNKVLNHPPSEITHGGAFGTGLTLRYRKAPRSFGENTAAGALRDALMYGRDGGGAMDGVEDPALPENYFLIVVGQKE